jgi:ribokinase
VEGPSGHALIQVVPDGTNSIIIHGGANKKITREYIESVMDSFTSGDYLLLQNEINSVPEIMARGAELNMKIVFNPAPMVPDVVNYPLETVDCFILNETEGRELTGEEEAERILTKMVNQYPGAVSVLTLGEKGALLGRENERLAARVEKVQAVDTTAAGDTFTGFFLASLASGRKLEHALDTACKAAAICVTRAGAADSIPSMEEVLLFAGDK